MSCEAMGERMWRTFRPMLRKLRRVRRIVDMVAGGAVLEEWAVALVVAIEALEPQARGQHSGKARDLLAVLLGGTPLKKMKATTAGGSSGIHLF